MKKLIMILFAAITMTLTSCGVGSYSVVSGNADEAAVCFIASEKYDITVDIDGNTYELETIKEKQYKNRRHIKKTAQQEISVSPGRHQISVKRNGTEIYNHEIFISNTEIKVIEL
ncbi:MAG: hypothetical protein IKY27_09800 [Bacteroidales bacterium]|nr:hypothetical protein [Bacteroidales bacterium]MBR5782256.1 hypothetical protein [Bacteroidales bacterium]